MEEAYRIVFCPAYVGVASGDGLLEYIDPKLMEEIERREYAAPVSVFLSWDEAPGGSLCNLQILAWIDEDFCLELPLTLSPASQARLLYHMSAVLYGAAS